MCPITQTPPHALPRVDEAHPSPAAPGPPPLDEQAALDEVIYRLMREAELDPEDPVARATFLEEAAGAESVTIDGRTFTPHGVSQTGPTRVPVDADVFNENLPDAGL